MADIHGDVVEKPAQKHIAAPLSVYYVNCDVDSPGPQSLTASTDHSAVPPDTKLTPSPTPPGPPQAALDLLSNPLGADIYLDDKYIGKTPSSVTVAPGEHILIMRKPDYGTWSRKLQVVAGPRRVTAYLEQKILTLPSSQPQAVQQPSQPRATQPQVARPQAAQPVASVTGK